MSAAAFLDLEQAGIRLGVEGRPVSPKTIYDWIKRGKRAADGRIVKLRCVKLRGIVTKAEWLDEFVEALAAEPATPATIFTPGRRRKTAAKHFDADQVLANFRMA